MNRVIQEQGDILLVSELGLVHEPKIVTQWKHLHAHCTALLHRIHFWIFTPRKSINLYLVIKCTVTSLIIFEPYPLFQEKWLIIVFQAFDHTPTFEINIWTPTLCGAQTEVAKHVLAFDSLCGDQTEVAKCVLPFDILCRAQTGVRERLRQSAELNRVAERLPTPPFLEKIVFPIPNAC